MASVETAPKPFAFVLMPFSKDFDDIYSLGINAAATEAGTFCQRVDEQRYEGTILQRIYNQIAKTDIIVADMTGKNPNVFYEIGYAHALNKQVISLTQDAGDIPFDLKSYPHLVYEGKILELKEDLYKWIRWIVENPSERLARVELNLKFYINGVEIDKEKTQSFMLKSVGKNLSVSQFTLPLDELTRDIHNPTQRIYHRDNSNIAIITSSNFPRSTNTSSASLTPEGTYIHMLHPIGRIFPGGWQSVSLEFGAIKGFPLDTFTIRSFTELGSEDFAIEVYPER